MCYLHVATLALGLWGKQELAKLWAKSEVRESHLMLLGVQKNVREWTLTLSSELPLLVLKSQMNFWIFKEQFQGTKLIGLKRSIEKFLERRFLKWACMTHLNIWNTSYGQKKRQKSNEQFDSRPLKVENWPNFLTCKWSVTYCWKSVNEGYNFALDLIVIKGLHAKLWAPKSQEFQLWEFQDS